MILSSCAAEEPSEPASLIPALHDRPDPISWHWFRPWQQKVAAWLLSSAHLYAPPPLQLVPQTGARQACQSLNLFTFSSNQKENRVGGMNGTQAQRDQLSSAQCLCKFMYLLLFCISVFFSCRSNRAFCAESLSFSQVKGFVIWTSMTWYDRLDRLGDFALSGLVRVP